MQTNQLIWHLVYLCWDSIIDPKGATMSKTASLGFTPSATLFSRLLSAIDRVLMANALIAARNGDLPYFGL
jgi:hypothetical protein